ncbi:hypothetical protein [Streptomyces griseoflavus]|uniref:hypothetical protein n=1 Tax=Streptomyces griseoflavus TaxID=35619 RepID=UPI0001B4CC3E|nr:hypothetical protein [Streptomyces griseoflavus]
MTETDASMQGVPAPPERERPYGMPHGLDDVVAAGPPFQAVECGQDSSRASLGHIVLPGVFLLGEAAE